MDYFLHLLIMIEIYLILTISLNLIAGHTGLLNLAHAAFYGVGAYSTAVLTTEYDTSFLAAALLSILLCVLLSLTLAVLASRIEGDLLVIATFGLHAVIFSVINNWDAVTKGPRGISNIPSPNIASFTINSKEAFFLLGTLLVTLTIMIAQRIVRSPSVRLLHAILADAMFPADLGRPVSHANVSRNAPVPTP
ncbi:MAG: branched-chain amino acid ABC transporter permease, partial [Pseudomonadales bacterium]|nr:branched-chain amino acid ABC transporter permease [Pseudomonadales bacterium]